MFNNPQRENTRRFIRRLKVLDLEITSKDYDFLGTMGEIEQYCTRNQIPPTQSYRIQLAFEELTQQIVPKLAKPQLTAVIEWSETEQRATLAIRHNGPAFDVATINDSIAADVLGGITSTLECTRDEGNALPNSIVLTIRA